MKQTYLSAISPDGSVAYQHRCDYLRRPCLLLSDFAYSHSRGDTAVIRSYGSAAGQERRDLFVRGTTDLTENRTSKWSVLRTYTISGHLIWLGLYLCRASRALWLVWLGGFSSFDSRRRDWKMSGLREGFDSPVLLHSLIVYDLCSC